jgi:2,5-diketo-D-gluconate reductase A
MSDLNVSLPSGGSMPLIGLGTWQMRGRTCYEAVRHALDVGYRHIDTATMYGNEAEVGRALADSRVPRGDVFITTKLQPRNVGRERQTIEASLRALGTDYVDLWLIHWPPRGRALVSTWKELPHPAGGATPC